MRTAIRETEEESGLPSSSYEVLKEFPITLEYPARGKPKRVDYWLAYLNNPDTPVKLSHEHQDFKWLNAADAIRMTHDNMTDIWRNAEAYLAKQDKYKK